MLLNGFNNHYHSYFRKQMKQVINTESGYKTTIDIPYSAFGMKRQAKSNENAIDEKIISICHGNDNCHRCCGSSNKVSYRVIEQLERSYDNDIQQYEKKIKNLKQDNAFEIQKLKNNYSNENQRLSKEIQGLKTNLKFSQEEISRLSKSKIQLEAALSSLMRNKINEFKEIEHQRKIKDLQNILKLRDDQILALAQRLQRYQADSLENINEIEKLKLKNLRESQQFTLKNDELTQANSILKQKIQDLQSELQKLSKNSHDSNLFNSKMISELNLNFDMQIKKNLELKDIIKKLDLQIYQKCTEIQRKNTQIGSLKLEIDQLKLKESSYQNKVSELQSKIDDLSKQSQKLQQLIEKLSFQLKNKEKVYQVKIERVIDGKDQIDRFQSEIIRFKKCFEELEGDRDRLSDELKKKIYDYENSLIQISKLTQTVAELKAYILKKQKSFAWVVERQIEKDIQISEKDVNQIYKVLQVKECEKQKLNNLVEEKNRNPINAEFDEILRRRDIRNISSQIVIVKSVINESK